MEISCLLRPLSVFAIAGPYACMHVKCGENQITLVHPILEVHSSLHWPNMVYCDFCRRSNVTTTCWFHMLGQRATIYSNWLGSRTTVILFDPRTDLLPEAAGRGQQISSRVKQNCCCPRSQSINRFVIHLYFVQNFRIHSHYMFAIYRPRIWMMPRHCDVNITWNIEIMKIRPSVNSSIAGNRLTNCWPVNRIVLQLIRILLLTVKMLCIYCIAKFAFI